MPNFYANSLQARFKLSKGSSAFITQLVTSSRASELPTTIALAIAVSKTAMLPAGAVESIETYFMDQAGRQAAEAIGVVNELVPVNYRLAIDIAKQLYHIRYETSAMPFRAMGYDMADGIAALFGLSKHLSKDVLACMQSNAGEISMKAGRFEDILNELRKV